MTDPVVVGVALRDDDKAPLALGRAMARFTGAPLALLHIYPYQPLPPMPSPAFESALQEHALQALEELARPLREELEVTVRVAADPSPARGLHWAAEALDAALLVLGSSHRGRLGRVVPGGVGERLLHAAPCAVAIAPRGYAGTADDLRRIGVGFVDATEGREALAAGRALAALGDAALSVYTVLEPPLAAIDMAPGWVPPPDYHDEQRERIQALAERARASVPGDLLDCTKVLEGDAAEALSGVSAELDLLVCGSRGYGPLRSVLLGGVSARLAHTCSCPLLLIPRDPGRAPGRSRAREGAAAAPGRGTTRG